MPDDVLSDNPGFDAYVESFRPPVARIEPLTPPPLPPEPPRAPPRAAPKNVEEARARIGEFMKDREKGAKLFSGDWVAKQEYRDAQMFIEKHPADEVDVAMAGLVPKGEIVDSNIRMMENVTEHLRELGINDGPIRQLLAGEKVSAVEHRAVEVWLNDRMGDAAWLKRYLAGEPEPQRQMTLAHIVLNSEIAEK